MAFRNARAGRWRVGQPWVRRRRCCRGEGVWWGRGTPSTLPVERAVDVEQVLWRSPIVFGDQDALQMLGVNLDEFHVFVVVDGWVESAS